MSAAIAVMTLEQLETLLERVALRVVALMPAPGPVARDESPAGIAEAAKLLGCSQRQVRRLIACGRLEASKLNPGGSSRVLVSRTSIAKLRAQGVQ